MWEGGRREELREAEIFEGGGEGEERDGDGVNSGRVAEGLDGDGEKFWSGVDSDGAGAGQAHHHASPSGEAVRDQLQEQSNQVVASYKRIGEAAAMLASGRPLNGNDAANPTAIEDDGISGGSPVASEEACSAACEIAAEVQSGGGGEAIGLEGARD